MKKIRKKKLNIVKFFRFIVIIILFSIIVFLGLKKLIIKKEENILTEYINKTNYIDELRIFNNSLYIDKFEKNESGYNLLNSKDWNIKSIKDNEQDVILEDLFRYIDNNKISINDIHLYISKENKDILSINSNVEFEDEKFQNYIKYMEFMKIFKDKIDINSTVKILRNDLDVSNTFYKENSEEKYIQIIKNYLDENDKSSKNILIRSFRNKNISENSIEKIFNTPKKNNIVEIQKDFMFYVENINDSDSIFKNIINKSESIFSKTTLNNDVYNISSINNGIKIEFGYIKKINTYYCVYSEKLDEKIINDIGDIITRKLYKVDSINKISY